MNDKLPEAQVNTLVDALAARARGAQGEATAFTWLEHGEHAAGRLGLAQLDARARAIAARLQALCAPGERVLLACPPGLDYTAAFFGCLYAGLVAVPALPPANARTLPRLAGMVRDAQPRVALSSADTVQRMRALARQDTRWPEALQWRTVAELAQDADAAAAGWRRPDIAGGDIAFLQYTSGSTGTPKGVMVTHANLLANARAIGRTYGLEAGDTLVCWLPPHHDFGLIGGIVAPVVLGAHCVQFAPAAFLMRPQRWLRAISDWRAKATGGPNFAYALCVDKVADAHRQGLDLSCLRVMVNGAERVRSATVRAFAEAFAGCGLRADAMRPSYGLAESTLLVSAAQPEPGALAPMRRLDRLVLAADRVEEGAGNGAIELVAAGLAGRDAADGREVLVVDAQARTALPPRAVGEIWVRGPSVAAGYWGRADESEATFGACLAGDAQARRWLRTGDLGFVDEGGQLYVTGRLKEMMIFDGENVYPQDVEATVEAQDAAFRADGCAAFSVEDDAGRARLVVVQELESRRQPDTQALAERVRAALYERHGLTQLAALLLVRAGQLPRTSSGKIQRVRCRALWQDGGFDAVWQWSADDVTAPGGARDPGGDTVPATPTEAALAGIWQHLLGLERVPMEADFLALGGHSLLAAQVAAQVRAQFGIALEVQQLFEAPTVRALARCIDARIGTAQAEGAMPPLVPLHRAVAPQSFAQQRLWFLDQYAPGDASHNIAVGFRLAGPLRVDALQAALDAVVARHAALRTRFGHDAATGEPVQIVEPALQLALPVEHGDAGDVQALAAAEARKPFDLRQGPLLRARLLRLAPDAHVLLLTVHHIVSDGWSMGVLAREVSALYAAQLQGLPPPLAPLAVQYADYAAWQRQWLQGPVLQRQLDYWRAQLAGAPALLALPTDRPRPQHRTGQGASLPFTLDAQTTQALRALCQVQGVTLFMGLLAGFSLLLARLGNQHDVSVGTFTANRPRAELEPLVGFFLNTLVLRTRLQLDQDVPTLLRAVRDTTLDAYAHQHVPFEQLLEALRPERATSYTPLFQVMLVLQNLPDRTLALPGMQAEPLPMQHQGAKFDLTLELWEDGLDAGLTGRLEYSTNLFDDGTVARLGARLQRLLRALIAAPHAPLASHDLLDAAEHEQLRAWNATGTDYPRDVPTARWFAERVQAHPDATALEFQGERVSYRALDARASQLAQHLRARGVGPDVLVGVCLERGVEMVVALLGILKAGGAYLPLDPDYPAERLGLMLQDARPALVITQQALNGRLPPHGLPVLDPVAQAAQLAALPAQAPPLAAAACNLAYVIYTSGSTGRPKGVAITQRNLNSQVVAIGRRYGIRPADRLLQFAALSFDMSVEEIFATLLHGATLVLRDDSWIAGPREFAALSERHGITLWNLPTGFWRHLVHHPGFVLPAGVRQAMIGGEAALPADLQAWFARAPHAGLLNGYGPTEATVNATSHRPSADPASWNSIGGPIGNTRIHVLDAQLAPVPVGVAGEVYVGGEHIARGYLGRPDLTAERFIPEPFAETPGARMYRTGDLARWRPDGTLEFLGRLDHQVKVRGFRIELGEIEAALAAQRGVREALVLVREDAPGQQRLVAYASPKEGCTLDAAGLRAALARQLPDYMVPALFVLLPAFPLLPNGKIDRKALPAPDAGALASEAYEPPQGPVEEAIAAAWAEALGLPRVGRHDNFFALGGHSLLAVGIAETLRRQGIATPLRGLFSSPTVAGLAQAATEAEADAAPPADAPASGGIPAGCERITPAMVPLAGLEQDQLDAVAATVPGGARAVQDVYPLAPLQEGILFHHRADGAAGEGDPYLLRSVMAFDSRALLDRFLEALQAVIARHDVLRTALRWEGLPHPVQLVLREARLPVTELPADGDASPAGDAPPRALLDATDPSRVRLDLRRAPLLATWVQGTGGDGPCWLALLIHHTISDHVTVQLLLEEVRLLLQGEGASLPAPRPYRGFVAQALAVPPEAHTAYFRAQLADVDEPTAPFGVLQVPADAGAMRESRTELPAALAAALRAAARRHGMAPAVLFHLAWARCVAATSGRDDVVFGTLLLGRSQGVAGADRMPGLFINTLPLRLPLAGLGVRDALHATRERLGALVAHEQAPLALAQRASGVAAGLPLFSALLNVRHGANQDGRIAWAGMRVARYEERTNYPLALAVDDLGEAGFALTAQVQGLPVGPERVCAGMRIALGSLVELLAQSPEAPVHAIQVVPADELRRLLVSWNASDAPFARERTAAQQFEAQVAADGNAVAVVDEGGQLTRAALNARANRLAHRLRARGVGPDVLVALCMQPGLDAVVGLLGVLKAGGAWLPLDPAYPAGRLAQMLDDARPALVLTHAAAQGALPAQDIPVLRIDGDDGDSTFAAQPPTNPAPSGGPLNLAYVIYTSGSTGRPKGVAVPRQAMANILAHIARTPGPLPDGPASWWTSISFDPAVQEIFTALACGAPLHIVPPALRGDPAPLMRWMAERGIAQAFLPPAIVRWMIESPERTQGLRLRRLATGVESLPEDGLWALQQRLPGLRIEDGYGPTEATLYAASMTALQPLRRPVPIGRPVSNAKLYVLDARLQPVPAGVAGEVFIAGAGLARGYLNRPDLTAERFLPDPFGAPGTRMYRTGDLAWHGEDGHLVFAGRADQQVKVRGFRVEPGEIESQLLRAPGVAQALVLAQRDERGENQLVAYVVPREREAIDAQALRARLARTLPGYMVPTHIVPLDALPLTPNGKIDRKALPAPQAARGTEGYAAPRTPLEERMARIWAEVLRVERVGLADNFFALGGHSLVAVQLVERLRAEGFAVDVRGLFTHPTIASLLAAGATAQAPARAQAAVPPNRIPDGCTAITPDMLPLADLTPAQIEAVARQVPGGMANIQDIYPLAPLQEGLLFHHLMAQRGDAYLLDTLLAFDARARIDRFADALRQLVARHDVLRTAILWDGLPQPLQVVWRHAGVPIEERVLDPQAGDAAAQLRAQPARLDLRSAPLLRCVVLHDAPNARWLVQVLLHHLVTDAAGLALLAAELKAVLDGQGAALPPAVPYREHVARARLGMPAEAHEAFFRAMLAGVDEPTAPFGLVDALADGTAVREARLVLDAQLAQRLRRQARQAGVNPASLLHLAWAQLMARASGRADVVFGTVLFGRMQGGADAGRALGMFINTLPLRVRLGDAPVGDALRTIHRDLAALLAHEHAPLALAQRCSGVQAPTPLFAAVLNYRHGDAGTRALAQEGWHGMRVLDTGGSGNYPLNLSVDDLGEDFAFTAQVQGGRVDPERVCGWMATALESIAALLEQSPHTPVRAVEVVPAAERHALLVDWNASDAPFDRADTVVRQFETQAAADGEAVALVFEGDQLTRAGLNARANRLAHHLRARGVGPDVPVGVCMEPGIDLVVGLLAVLKAGGAYLPLDPAYPAERLAQMLADARPALVLTHAALRAALPVEDGAVFRLDADGPALQAQPDTNPATAAGPDHLAYVIYTSGSSGRPKGVGVPHRAVGNILAHWRRVQAPLPAGPASLWTSVSFDPSVHEIFNALTTGAPLHVVPQALRGDPAMLVRWLGERGIVQAFVPPAFMRWAVEAPQRFAGLALQRILTGVEPLPESGLHALQQLLPGLRIDDGYGPTEATLYAAHYTAMQPLARTVPLGRPVSNARLYVLDADLQPVPWGAAGEVFIAGEGLARGYLNRPELTAERFLPDPFGAPGTRMYRTGDLAWHGEDGHLVFAGRADQQVKVRGFRVEPGEVEARLLRAPGVAQALVLARRDAGGENQLVAYVVPREGEAVDADALRAHLGQSLPHYMVPGHIVPLDALPLTPNGKIDRTALPAPEAARAAVGDVAPRTPLEQELAAIWAEVLGLPRVGVHDNFFALGGHSLLATQAISRLRERIASELPLQALFEAPTVAEMAARVETLRAAAPAPGDGRDEKDDAWAEELL